MQNRVDTVLCITPAIIDRYLRVHTSSVPRERSERYKHMPIRRIFDILNHERTLQTVKTASVLDNGNLATKLWRLEKPILIDKEFEL
jgi:hypothetical protein